MRTDSRKKPVIAIILSAIVLVVFCTAFPATAHAEDSGDDDDSSSSSTAGLAAVKSQWGVGVRLRSVFVPKGLIEMFVESAPSGISTVGFGAEIVRRKGNMELILGFEYEKMIPNGGTPSECASNAPNCIWIDKDGDADLVEFDKFGWFTVDFMFAWRSEFSKMVALRYGAGIGLGFVLGKVVRTDYICPGGIADSTCRLDPAGQTFDEEDVPPVFPVINAMIGLQITPINNLSINIEAGIRTFPFIGTSANYFF